jgi:hypothetical protein
MELRLTASVDGLPFSTRQDMNDYISGSNVLRTYKRPKIEHDDDPEAQSWARDIVLEKKQHEIASELRSGMLETFTKEMGDHEFTRTEACFVNKIMKFATSLKATTDVMSKTIYEKAWRGMLIMHRKHDDLACFDRKLERRDLRAEKLEADKTSGVETMRKIHDKLVETTTKLKTTSDKGKKAVETIDSVMLMVGRGRCMNCKENIIDGFIMHCKTSMCGKCADEVDCPCSNHACGAAYPHRSIHYMQDMAWLTNLMETASVEDDADVATNIQKNVKDYLQGEFDARSSHNSRMSPEL